MTYFPMGADGALAYNSTKYPGVCKPMDEDTLQVVYGLQNQVNRIAKMKGLKLIAVDGDIGPGTVAAVNAIAPLLKPTVFDTSSCSSIGAAASAIAVRAESVADSLGAPAKVSAPIPPKAPTIITPAGVELKAPPPVGASLLDSVKNLGTPTLLALGVGAVVVGYVVSKDMKKGGGASKPGIRYRTRHRTRYITRRIRSRR